MIDPGQLPTGAGAELRRLVCKANEHRLRYALVWCVVWVVCWMVFARLIHPILLPSRLPPGLPPPPPPSFTVDLVRYVGLGVLALPVFLVSAGIGGRRRGAAAVTACLQSQVCPSCGYSLREILPAEDGARQCPECGGAWRMLLIKTDHS
jgi:hypothetical protein